MEESGLELPESNPHSNNEFRSLLESASNSSDRKDINSSTEFSDSSSDASSTHEKISDPLPVKHEVTYWSLVRDNRHIDCTLQVISPITLVSFKSDKSSTLISS